MEEEVVKETVEHPETVHPAPEHVAPPVDPGHADEEIRRTVHEHNDRLSALETLVQSIAPTEQDSRPTKRPWTHWGNSR